jgi:glucose-6-phosphate-specific signal transduction histidine kinase
MPELLAYMRSNAIDYFDYLSINLSFDYPSLKIENTIPVNKFRRNIFLVFKEALNNIAKHSQATESSVVIKLDNESFSLKISDTGMGIEETKNNKYSNGLKNMEHRISEIGGKFDIISEKIRKLQSLSLARVLFFILRTILI